jgi:predicted 2-oxoglutarate/Fe(II)-dependent dioxygenase YbiX
MMLAEDTAAPQAVDEWRIEPLDALRERARQGDASAMCRLGMRLVIGCNAPLEPREALTLIGAATERGDAEATGVLATFAAAGTHRPQNWTEALDLLQLAAERGLARARGQLRLLAQDRAMAASLAEEDPRCWKTLREAIDVGVWTQPPPRVSLCESPRIRFSEAFTRPDICAWLVDRSRGRFKRARMFDGTRPTFAASRNNSDYHFDIVNADLVLALVRERVAALVRLPVPQMEVPQIFHYAQGEEIKAHFDHVRGQGGVKAERIATLLLYLNDDYEGGELEFPKVGVRRKGRAGDAIYFANVDAAGQPDPLSLHAALPVTRGEKWIFSQWIQDRTFGSAA